MFELVTATKRPTWRERIARAMDRGIALSRWERFGRAFFWACLGFSVCLGLVQIVRALIPVPPVQLLDPVIEHSVEPYTVYRLRFEWRATQKSCELTVFHDRQIWRLTCEPR